MEPSINATRSSSCPPPPSSETGQVRTEPPKHIFHSQLNQLSRRTTSPRCPDIKDWTEPVQLPAGIQPYKC